MKDQAIQRLKHIRREKAAKEISFTNRANQAFLWAIEVFDPVADAMGWEKIDFTPDDPEYGHPRVQHYQMPVPPGIEAYQQVIVIEVNHTYEFNAAHQGAGTLSLCLIIVETDGFVDIPKDLDEKSFKNAFYETLVRVYQEHTRSEYFYPATVAAHLLECRIKTES